MKADPFFHGALDAEAGYPRRLTPQLSAWYHGLSREFADRADCTAGVSLAFVTRAKRLSFAYECVAYCRSLNVVDVMENGVHTGSVRLADMQSHGRFTFERETEGLCAVELILPNTCGIRVTEADFGACAPVEAKEKKLLLLGDSILQGIASYAPSCSLGYLLARALGAEAVNQSVGGARVWPQTLAKPAFEPDDVLVALGANDIEPLWEEPLEARAAAYFQKLRALCPRARITAITPIWSARMRDAEYAKKARAVDGILQNACAGESIRVVAGNPLTPHVARFFNEDGTHPNDLGFMAYASNLLKQW